MLDSSDSKTLGNLNVENLVEMLSKDDFQQLVVIEAKRNNLDYGFTQLAAQMICLDQWDRSPSVEQQPVLVGAVTTGEVWKFVRLDRRAKRIMEGLNLFTVQMKFQRS